ncbi:hypothetical protein SASPL_155634 [Salvia splendens]|uniref:Uncharacterized protein n=1 Tax=Salvia splendens TaxID=180675 RepID=A0A8X8VY89_SALSN|nr:hypothetical protein SASPL_155634 [Salvia splendens]
MNMCKWIASRDGSPVDLSERLYMSSYDVIVRAAVKAKSEERKVMVSVFMESTKLATGFMMADLYPSVKLLPLITGARFKIRRLRRKVDEVLDGIIEQQRAAADDGDDDTKLEDFLDILLKYEKDGTLTTDNVKAVLLRPEYWNDPEEFIPERFEESTIDFNGSNLEYIPFGAGRRTCPGMLLGQANMELPLAMLLYHFDWEIPNGMKAEELDMTEGLGSTLHREHHLRLIPIVKRPLCARA